MIDRIGNFDTLYSFYGQDKYTKDRYFNRNNQDREFARIVKLLFVGDVTNLVCGDATMPKGLKGNQSSLDAKFCAYVERVKGKGTVIFCTEHRTSILDSNTRKVMYRPKLPLSKKKLEKRKKWKEKLAGQAEVGATDNMEVEENRITERWGGGLDRIERLAEMKSNGKGIFRQEQKKKEEGVRVTKMPEYIPEKSGSLAIDH